MNNKKVILAITAGNINLASSRLRSFKLFNDFDGYIIHRDFNIKNFISSKHIHIQKKTNALIILLVILSRAFNKNVIFDFDDDHFSNRENIFRIIIFLFSNSIIVDTKSRLCYILAKMPSLTNKIYYLPDMLDFDLSKINKSISYNGCENLNILWYGYPNNIGSIKFVFEYLLKKENKHIYIISSSKQEVIDNLGEVYWNEKNCHFIKWEPDILYNFNPQNHLVILNHDWERNSNLKSENKLVLAMALGFPVIASNTQAYYDFCLKISATKILYQLNEKFDFDVFLENLSTSNLVINENILFNTLNESFSKQVIQSMFNKILAR